MTTFTDFAINSRQITPDNPDHAMPKFGVSDPDLFDRVVRRMRAEREEQRAAEIAHAEERRFVADQTAWEIGQGLSS